MTTRTRSDAGFSLPEVLISMGIMLVVLAGTFSAMTQAMKGEELVRLTTNMNSSLRSTMDLAVRDFLQIGQGLPDSRRIGVPNGAGALPIFRPGPTAGEAAPCPGVPATFPADATIPAVTVGPGLGAQVNGVCSDLVTILAADGTFDSVPLRAIAANGSSITVALPPISGGVDIDDGGGDDVRVGDLIMLSRAGLSTLMYVTAVNGPGQTLTFGGGDPFRLNQFDPLDADPATPEMDGTINQVINGAGEPTAVSNLPSPPNAPNTPWVAATKASRIRMLTYYVRVDPADPTNPRLLRQVNMSNVFPAPANPNGNTVGFGVEQFLLTYDLVDGSNNWIDVQMNAADRAGGGGCGAAPCSENMIRKVNVTLSMRSRQRFSTTREFMRNSLYSQVAVRSLAFTDRYR
jgi:prepilin-type N-terminal cleavage/methylation domain-containing protein